VEARPALVAALAVLAVGAFDGSAGAFVRPPSSSGSGPIGRWLLVGDGAISDVTIAAKGELFDVRYAARDGSGRVERGLGMMRDEQLFVSLAPAPFGGLAVYRFADDGSARGAWSDLDSMPAVGAVEIDANVSRSILGEHVWYSAHPLGDGTLSRAAWPVSIEPYGEALRLRWGSAMAGPAVQVGRWVGVTWARPDAKSSVVVYDFAFTPVPGRRVVTNDPVVHAERLVRVW
jgi:hypothetical protein